MSVVRDVIEMMTEDTVGEGAGEEAITLDQGQEATEVALNSILRIKFTWLGLARESLRATSRKLLRDMVISKRLT